MEYRLRKGKGRDEVVKFEDRDLNLQDLSDIKTILENTFNMTPYDECFRLPRSRVMELVGLIILELRKHKPKIPIETE